MRDDGTSGILVVGHGSRRQEANDDIREAARRIGMRGAFTLVEAAFLEIERPNIADGFKQLVERGARNVIVHPYFLSPGRHTRGDLPREVHDAARHFPGVCYQITEPLSAHPLVIDAAVERIRETHSLSDFRSSNVRPGTVYLVGAGPGDPGLLTVRARDVLVACDVVVYDYLIDPEVLRLIPPQTERIYAGKVGYGQRVSQEKINWLLIDRALNGQRVVRLKGGDPFLFGRGGEEGQALFEAGVPFEIVPGISSALAVPAYAGIPLTHREHSASVAILTGASAGDIDDVSTKLAELSQADTIVILMGVANLPLIANVLCASGRNPDTPVAIIRWGTYETQQTLTGTLRSITEDAARAGMRAPAVIVIGEVVRLSKQLNWFKKELATNSELAPALAAFQLT